jgi:Trk K+ transport system NAD-binding subunit
VEGAVAERRRRRLIQQLESHYICGYGRVGRRIAEEFRDAEASYVVLDFNRDVRLETGDHVIAVGTPDELGALEELFAPPEALAG